MDTARLPAPRPVDRWSLFGIASALVGLRIVGFVLLAFLVVAVCLLVIWIGLPLLLAFLATLRWFARLHRRLAGRVLGTVVLDPYLPVPEGGLFVRLRVRLTDRATWRDVAWLFEVQTIGFALQLAALISFPFLPVGWWGSPLLLRMDASVTRLLLSSQDERLHQRIDELESSRQHTVDHSSAELRRIERDLHDGAQAQLVALGMNLGLAQELVTRDPAAAADLIAEARVSSSTALSDLRSLVRGIHPPVLADRGLAGAVEALALAHPRPVETDIVLDGRPPAPVESAVYFAVAEVLTNSAKYAAAQHTWVWIRDDGGVLTVMVGDDGVGGAEPTVEGGLAGVQRRLAAFDGTLSVASPLGGGTIVTVKVPCVLRVSTAA
ncbi:MAG TPA: sensor domain-containing protein [Nakamurella sp.]|jgi:signal transduction histidine kinase